MRNIKQQQVTKAQVRDFVTSLGADSRYSGNQNTMFIPEKHHNAVITKFGYKIPFTLGILNKQ